MFFCRIDVAPSNRGDSELLHRMNYPTQNRTNFPINHPTNIELSVVVSEEGYDPDIAFELHIFTKLSLVLIRFVQFGYNLLFG